MLENVIIIDTKPIKDAVREAKTNAKVKASARTTAMRQRVDTIKLDRKLKKMEKK